MKRTTFAAGVAAFSLVIAALVMAGRIETDSRVSAQDATPTPTAIGLL